MKVSWKGWAIAIGLSILIFLNVLIGIYVYANITDWKVNFLKINPTEPSNERDFPVMTYPPSSTSGFQINPSTILFEDIYLKYNGTAAENQPLELSVVVTLSPDLANQIYAIDFYFGGASPYPVDGGTYSGGWGVILHQTDQLASHDINLGAFFAGNPTVLTWQVQGDYYPSITILYNNNTQVTQSYAGNPDFLMHIESADVLRTQSSSRVNTSIEVALAFFAFIDGTPAIGRFVLKRKGKKRRNRGKSGKTNEDSNQNPSTSPKPKPNKRQPYKKRDRNKSEPLEHGTGDGETNKVAAKQDQQES